jgi:hypothetical protein
MRPRRNAGPHSFAEFGPYGQPGTFRRMLYSPKFPVLPPWDAVPDVIQRVVPPPKATLVALRPAEIVPSDLPGRGEHVDLPVAVGDLVDVPGAVDRTAVGAAE